MTRQDCKHLGGEDMLRAEGEFDKGASEGLLKKQADAHGSMI